MGNIISGGSKFIRELVARYVEYFKTSNIVGKILLGLVPLIAACCICFGSIVVFGPDATPTPEVETELESTSIEVAEEPTRTEEAIEPTEVLPSATFTEPPPTATELSANTPEPTDTAEPTLSPTPPHPPGEEAVVTDIIDGDTIEVDIGGTLYAVRYIGIDAPEGGQLLSSEATQENTSLVAGQTVILVKDTSETDQYDRLLRYVYLLDGTFVNAELVRSGHAQVKSYPPDVTEIGYLEGIQQEAVSAELGLWGLPTSTPIPLPTNTAPPPPTEAVATATVEQVAAPTTAPPSPTAEVTPGQIIIIRVDKRAEYVDLQNIGGQAIDLSGWRLVSEKGNQECSLGGVIEPQAVLRVWAMEEDIGQG